MNTVNFEFKSGDFVRTMVGQIGVIVSCVEEYGDRYYLVDTTHSRKPYREEQLVASDDRPFDEMAKRTPGSASGGAPDTDQADRPREK